MMKVTPGDLLEGGTTVAINRAISIRNRVPIDVWAVWDDPNKLFELGYGEHVYPPLQIWVGPNRFQEQYLAAMGRVEPPEWERLLHPLIGLRAMPWGTADGEHETLGAVQRTVFSLVYGIEKAVDLGARHIRIFGADMAGPWAEGKTETECVLAYGERWTWERETLRRCIEAADEEEVFIEVIGSATS
jgi:hypothetical protein